mmetsp:Transcript_25489/g.76083  ORF Transcript_25489/g.76083 Transcript_25489/m.76083 type:complete len:205 (-) Transcript_25489:180-794(-)
MSHERGGVLCMGTVISVRCGVDNDIMFFNDIMYETHRVRFAAAAITCATYSEQREGAGPGCRVRRTAHATARAPPSGASLSRVSSRAPGSACEAVDKGTEDGAVAHPASAHWPPWASTYAAGCGACAGRRSASASSGTAQYMSSSLWVSMTQSEVGLAVHVRTQPAAFCSSERKPHAEVSIVPETSLPAQALHEPARQAYGRSA